LWFNAVIEETFWEKARERSGFAAFSHGIGVFFFLVVGSLALLALYLRRIGWRRGIVINSCGVALFEVFGIWCRCTWWAAEFVIADSLEAHGML
jgi:hypothetical protein